MKERPSQRTIEQATEFVNEYEEWLLAKLSDIAIVSCRRAEGCGCLQCFKRALIDDNNFHEETWRQYVHQEDQEEKWIADLYTPLLNSGDKNE